MKLPALTPVRLRQVLSACLLLVTIMGAGLFYYASTSLEAVAKDVSKTTQAAKTSQDYIQTLKQLSKSLETKEDIIERADKVRADSTAYRYQDQIINSLNTYANRAGVSITNIDFASAIATPGAVVSGPKAVAVAVTLKSPMEYVRLIHFIESVEKSLTKMQLSKINLTKGTDSSSVSTDILNLAVYVK
jgi:hypothetical protein